MSIIVVGIDMKESLQEIFNYLQARLKAVEVAESSSQVKIAVLGLAKSMRLTTCLKLRLMYKCITKYGDNNYDKTK